MSEVRTSWTGRLRYTASKFQLWSANSSLFFCKRILKTEVVSSRSWSDGGRGREVIKIQAIGSLKGAKWTTYNMTTWVKIAETSSISKFLLQTKLSENCRSATAFSGAVVLGLFVQPVQHPCNLKPTWGIHCNGYSTYWCVVDYIFLNELVLSRRNYISLCQCFHVVVLNWSIS